PDIVGAAGPIAGLLGPDSKALFTANGIPWWWNHGLRADGGGPLDLLDPGGALWRLVTPQRALGCVTVSSNSVVSPGLVNHRGGNSWLIGAPDGAVTPYLDAVVTLLRDAGLQASSSSEIRLELWRKLFRNLAYYSVCSLTRLLPKDAAADP